MDMMEEKDNEFDIEEGTADKVKSWLQENLRVIVSVFIVAAIALGIYSYSDRGEPTTGTEVALEETSSASTEKTDESTTEEDGEPATEEAAPAATTETVAPTEASRETEGSFVETAVAGNGLTHLARAATRHYLEKNPDSTLTVEHKVYIEDYLRKKLSHQGGVKVGTSVEFSKDLIKGAIESSKTLDARQLENLKQYSARVAEFRR